MIETVYKLARRSLMEGTLGESLLGMGQYRVYYDIGSVSYPHGDSKLFVFSDVPTYGQVVKITCMGKGDLILYKCEAENLKRIESIAPPYAEPTGFWKFYKENGYTLNSAYLPPAGTKVCDWVKPIEDISHLLPSEI